MTKPPKPKPCVICLTMFTPTISTTQVVCGWKCGIDKAQHDKEIKAQQLQKAAAKTYRKERREAKERVKTRREWLVEAQTAFNKFIRTRDAADPCISCLRYHTGQYHAGHYLSTGACPGLRFDEDNCHKQCASCNSHLSGNLVLYRVNLIGKIGLAAVEWLEGPHASAKFSIDELREIKATYAKKAAYP